MAPAVDISSLKAPLHFEFSGLSAKNRLLKAATTECLSTWDPQDLVKRGIPTPEVIRVYKRWAKGGYGMIVSGNIMLEYDQLEGAGNIIIPPDAPFSGPRFTALTELVKASKQHGSLFIAQLSHPGRQVPQNIQPYPISASAIQLEDNDMSMPCGQPRAMEKEDFQRVISGFAHAARYCYEAGFDGIELHAAQYVARNPMSGRGTSLTLIVDIYWRSSCHQPPTRERTSTVGLLQTAPGSSSKLQRLSGQRFPSLSAWGSK